MVNSKALVEVVKHINYILRGPNMFIEDHEISEAIDVAEEFGLNDLKVRLEDRLEERIFFRDIKAYAAYLMGIIKPGALFFCQGECVVLIAFIPENGNVFYYSAEQDRKNTLPAGLGAYDDADSFIEFIRKRKERSNLEVLMKA